MLTSPESETAATAPRIIFNLESLLIDTVVGVRHALNAVARTRHKVWLHHPLSPEDLGSRSLASVIAEIAGSDDAKLMSELTALYWRVYQQEGRFAAPLLPGAREWVERLMGTGAELHYVSTWGPTVATKFVYQHRLEHQITSIFAAPVCSCSCSRAERFENFMRTQVHPAHSYLLLSDSHAELLSAQRLGVPAIALAYGQTPAHMLESTGGLLGVAESLADAGHWILAQSAAATFLRRASRRRTLTLH